MRGVSKRLGWFYRFDERNEWDACACVLVLWGSSNVSGDIPLRGKMTITNSTNLSRELLAFLNNSSIDSVYVLFDARQNKWASPFGKKTKRKAKIEKPKNGSHEIQPKRLCSCILFWSECSTPNTLICNCPRHANVLNGMLHFVSFVCILCAFVRVFCLIFFLFQNEKHEWTSFDSPNEGLAGLQMPRLEVTESAKVNVRFDGKRDAMNLVFGWIGLMPRFAWSWSNFLRICEWMCKRRCKSQQLR